MLKEMLIVGSGGFLGSCLRYLTGKLCASVAVLSFPLSTFLVNVLGCFLIGLLFGVSEKTGILTSGHMLFLITGFCGGFTTFSTFANDIWVLGTKGECLMMAFYMIATMLIGVAAVCLGRYLAN